MKKIILCLFISLNIQAQTNVNTILQKSLKGSKINIKLCLNNDDYSENKLKKEMIRLKTHNPELKSFFLINLFKNKNYSVFAVISENSFENIIEKMYINNVFNSIIIYDYKNNSKFYIKSEFSVGNIYFESKKRFSIIYDLSILDKKIYLLDSNFKISKSIENFSTKLQINKYSDYLIESKTITTNNNQNDLFDIYFDDLNIFFSNNNDFEKYKKCNNVNCSDQVNDYFLNTR